MAALPIDPLVPDIVRSLESAPNLVIEAAPGAGKTTRVPAALLGFGPVVVLEPRRIAARMAARRVAAEMGEQPGETVGYQVRYEDVSSPRTRLRFVTEGVLTRRLLSDPSLRGTAVVVLDEFHERHLETDLALALVRRLQLTERSDMRVVVMSATLDAGPVREFLGGCPAIRSEGRLFPLSVSYTPHSPEPLENLVASALERSVKDGLDGDVLVFLPGAAEIRRATRACEGLARAHDLLVLPLHGDLPPAEQDRAVSPADRRKVILSTNVAESSITIDGVSAVIDSGLARMASDDAWSGLPKLELKRISRASANQRAGRAGRTGPGRVIRLYSAEDFARRHDHDPPDIRRRELSQIALDLLAMRIDSLRWLEPPPEAAWKAAHSLLSGLDAVADGRLTATGREMARYPLHPRLARLVAEAARRGAADEGCLAAAWLGSGERLAADLLSMLHRHAPPNVDRLHRQLRRALPSRGAAVADAHAIEYAVLAAFSDRVARRRGEELILASGGSAAIAEPAAIGNAEYVVAVDIEDRSEQDKPLVRTTSPIRADWLLDLFPERVAERTETAWNRAAERVETVSRLLFDKLVLDESASTAASPEQSALLAAKAREAGIARFAGEGELNAWLARVRFAAAHGEVRELSEDDAWEALLELAGDARSFRELEAAAAGGGLVRALEARTQRALVERLAPERIRLPGGRSVKVHYEDGKPPWIASRLQDFFGMTETPRVGGSVAVVVHLLAPNQRPVQMTTDLAGFWERLYPRIRKELSRRYPRHSWPPL